MDRKDILLWWTNQIDCEHVSRLDPELPDYIATQFESRYGRAGRGRLWVDKHFKDLNIQVDPWPDTPIARFLGRDSGGIAFLRDDLGHVEKLPGVITDLDLNEISRVSLSYPADYLAMLDRVHGPLPH